MDCLAEGIRENWQNSVFLAVAGCCFVTNSALTLFLLFSVWSVIANDNSSGDEH